MSARCCKCDEEIPAERQIALIEMKVDIEKWTCVKCSPVERPFGIMVESTDVNGKASRKTGLDLVVIDPKNKEALRQAIRFKNRAR